VRLDREVLETVARSEFAVQDAEAAPANKQAASDKKVWVFRHVDPQVRLHEAVTLGERIAKVTKWRDGPSHAHIEIWKKFSAGYDYENMIDPMRYFA
jgi:hypothetical protein